MTEERRKYLASIGKEERKIRIAIAEEKSFISICKDHLNCSRYKNKTTYEMIASAKTKIKALKKQLPAPAEMECEQEYICPMCNTITQAPYKSMREMFYCPFCGQKLRQL